MKKLVQKIVVSAIMAGFGISTAVAADACQDCFKKRWIYFNGNITLPADYAALQTLIVQARKEGFNGIALNSGGDGSFTSLAGLPQNKYNLIIENTKKLVALASQNNIELIPVAGGPEVPAALNSNLVEALPTNTVFTVEGSTGRVKDLTNKIPDGGFDTTAGWGMDTVVTVDKSEGHTRAPAIKLTPSDGTIKLPNGEPNYNSRLVKNLKLPAHKSYKLSFWLKASPGYVTSDLFIQILDVASGAPAYKNGLGWALGSNGEWEAKSNRELFAENSSDWKKYELIFNTGNFTNLNLWFSNQTKGDPATFALIDDVELYEIGLPKLVDRASITTVVTGNGIQYAKGQDYAIDSINGKLNIPKGSRIASGQDVTVSWHQSGVNLAGRWNTPSTACTDGYFYWQNTLHRNLFQLFGNKFGEGNTNKYFMPYDDIRVMNWDKSCATGNNAADYLASTVNKVRSNIVANNKSVEILTWNQMFDPHVNARANYWQVNGSLVPSSVKLDSNIVVVNSAGGGRTAMADDKIRAASLNFFARRGHKQVAALYHDNRDSVKNWIEIISDPMTPALDGVMYTSWVYNKEDRLQGYKELEEVARLLRDNLPGKWPARQP
ncbi:hypothetical protein GJV26_04380 [Massilia dura]|uniref:CBM-cenC domain-containing protein n=1 Tax=Pseudoduganella dura TaxID=321982 RepID=A0A6I3X4S7_9BURK|nr:hypothetical protein [Pseudoduganella dura]MUI11724.1 hypothetical protein [Pseudoduganella dura]GGX78608.1 hypothetical protein GCM10007386_07020 [Pseudoduganella dura]